MLLQFVEGYKQKTQNKNKSKDTQVDTYQA